MDATILHASAQLETDFAERYREFVCENFLSAIQALESNSIEVSFEAPFGKLVFKLSMAAREAVAVEIPV